MAASAHTGVDQVSTAIIDVSDTLVEHTRQLNEAYQHFADTGRSYVRTSPVISIAIALAAGYGLSKLFSSCWRRCGIDPCTGISLTQSHASQTVGDSGIDRL